MSPSFKMTDVSAADAGCISTRRNHMAKPTDSANYPAFVGDVYARWTLDCLVEIGYAIALDFVNRPQLYLGSDIPNEIVTLRISYGTDPLFPNTVQRQAMM